ncbi:MAG: hypothetical protein A2X23_13610 [Chloroflexi bacterium GWC2_73_18]|nr:MAG: hypothetical protein A2X23_13610 [Chloroflexi bacterium GWC2_73_18]
MHLIRLSRRTVRTERRRQRGQALVLFTLGLIVMLGAAALTIDFGSWLTFRRNYQNITDAAVLAGTPFLTRPVSQPCTGSTSKQFCARREAWGYIDDQLGLGLGSGTLDGFAASNTGQGAPQVVPAPDGGTDYAIWVSTPPGGAGSDYVGRYPNDRRKIWARIDRVHQTFFGRVISAGDPTISAWATAGHFPNRFAVITLRQPNQAPTNRVADIFLAGTNTVLEVIDGDVGGNWNMKLNSGAQLWIRGQSDNDADTYLVEWISCGNSCWSNGQVSSGPNGSPAWEVNDPDELSPPIEDPDYPLPGPLTPPPNGPNPPAIPLGDLGGNVTVTSGGPNRAPGEATVVGGVLTCRADADGNPPRIGPGYYTNITVRSGECLILDPTMRHTSVGRATPDVATPVPSTQMPGIFYINGTVDINQSAMIVGDGVTVIIRPGSSNQFLVSAGGVANFNRGLIQANRRLGAWTTDGQSTYAWGGGQWGYDTSMNGNLDNVGMALYVIKREQYSSVAADNSSDVIKINAAAGLAWDGYTYAPHDNIDLAGQPGHDGIGQLVAWTVKFAGGVPVKQLYNGPEVAIPRLFEPRVP